MSKYKSPLLIPALERQRLAAGDLLTAERPLRPVEAWGKRQLKSRIQEPYSTQRPIPTLAAPIPFKSRIQLNALSQR